jgi:hypothetical protein
MKKLNGQITSKNRNLHSTPQNVDQLLFPERILPA